MKLVGGQHLRGEVRISGSKNAAGPLIAASLLFDAPVHLQNVPRLTDVMKLLEILESMGAKITWREEHDLEIDPRNLVPEKIDQKKMKSMRYSILLLGPLLARFRRVTVPEPGGCSIGNRPIDTHIAVLEGLGAKTETDASGLLQMTGSALQGGYILADFSVTATENLIMAAVLTPGTTHVRLAAAEPHVQDLCRFLVASGAKIEGIGGHDLEIEGVEKLTPPAIWSVISDANEAATFAIGAAVTHGDVRLTNIDPTQMDATISLLRRAGVTVETGADWMRVHAQGKLRAFRLQTMIYPGFPTDNQAPFGLLATQCHGTTLLHDPLFESRLGYLNELAKMGANVIIADPHRAVVNGPTPLHGTDIRSLDLRAGATMILAGLIAEGETVIHDAEIVYRGYEKLDERLRSLGASLELLKD
ncbi:UDP-N-acetylglucosamine 1-carboxyvinyltransferase [Patescibacteria group bacterium]|nr:UDP-N-acetylglucosamine 1-carboxyvinyltransferase [Patescibacteria group bacterium]